MINWDAVDEQIAEGFISRQKHEVDDLYIHNYTPEAQWSRHWTPETIACRGLITDGDRNIVARPFPKFFNYEDHSRSDIIFSKPFRIFEKMDGSLGILYRASDGLAIATRGSFKSDQAIFATDLLRTKYADFEPADGLTYLFEIIYPDNRIVVDYKGMEDIVLLGIRHTQDNYDLPGSLGGWNGPVAKEYEVESGQKFRKTDWIEELGLAKDGSQEGLVFCFDNSGEVVRVKMKIEEYKRLHYLMTNTSEKTVWEAMSTNTLRELVKDVPDEFYQFVKDISSKMSQEYQDIASRVMEEFELAKAALGYNYSDRKSFAMYVNEFAMYSDILFRMYDDRDFSDLIWKRIKP